MDRIHMQGKALPNLQIVIDEGENNLPLWKRRGLDPLSLSLDIPKSIEVIPTSPVEEKGQINALLYVAKMGAKSSVNAYIEEAIFNSKHVGAIIACESDFEILHFLEGPVEEIDKMWQAIRLNSSIEDFSEIAHFRDLQSRVLLEDETCKLEAQEFRNRIRSIKRISTIFHPHKASRKRKRVTFSSSLAVIATKRPPSPIPVH